MRCSVAISWAVTFFSPSRSQALCCVSSAFIFLCPHTSLHAMEIFFSPLSWLLEPRSASLPGIRSSAWICRSWVLACQEPRFVCRRVCLDHWGDTTPEEAWPHPSTTREGWTQARLPPLFVPLAGSGQPDAARTPEAGQGCPGPPGPASHPAPPLSFPSPLLTVPLEEGWANSS